MVRRVWLATIVASITVSSLATAHAAEHQPYAVIHSRGIRALSETQIADLLAGRGMGFALPAELNGYPGPRHVLDLADQLGLNPAQRGETEVLFASMTAETVPLGELLIRQEQALDRMFAERSADPDALTTLTTEIGETQGKLRAAHLRYHISTTNLLTPHQIRIYAELRGYGDAAGGSVHRPEAHPH